MLEATLRHRTDEQPPAERRSREVVVVLSCDRFRCAQVRIAFPRPNNTPRPVLRSRCTRINFQAHVHRISYTHWAGKARKIL